jgi:hypothetical protein
MNSKHASTQALRIPPLAGYGRQRRGRPAATGTYLQRLPLAGFEHHDARRLWPYLRTGQALLLSREFSNPVDPRAVRITWLGEHLGYLPRTENLLASDLLDHGAEIIARIHNLHESEDPWQRITLNVYLTRTGQ